MDEAGGSGIIMNQQTREILIMRYINALENDNFDVVGMVLQAAETDPILSQMIVELHHDPAVTQNFLVMPPRRFDSGYGKHLNFRKVTSITGSLTAAAAIVLIMFVVWLLSNVIPSDPSDKGVPPITTTIISTDTPTITSTIGPTNTPLVTPIGSPTIMATNTVPVEDCTPTTDDSPTVAVQSGDTLEQIATRFQVNVQDLLEINCLDEPVISDGQVINLPPLPNISNLGTNWFGYLWNAEAHQLRQVSLDGVTAVYDLGLPDGEHIGENAISVSPGGAYAVYCLVRTEDRFVDVYVQSLTSQTTTDVVQLDIQAEACQVTESAFIREGSVVVVSSASASGQWQMDIIDYVNGSLVDSLNSQDEIAQIISASNTSLPTITYYDSRNWLIFSFNADDYRFADGYRWHVDEGRTEVSTDSSILSNAYDYRFSTPDGALNTSEAIHRVIEESQELSGSPNIIRTTAKTGDEAILYRTINAMLLEVQYVYDGGRVVVLEGPMTSLDNPQPELNRWVMLGENLGDSNVQLADGNAVLDNAPNGLVIYQDGRLEYQGAFTRLLWEGDGDAWEWLWSYNPHHAQ